MSDEPTIGRFNSSSHSTINLFSSNPSSSISTEHTPVFASNILHSNNDGCSTISTGDSFEVLSPKETDSATMEAIESHFFEGVEKLLEVWFTESSGCSGEADLRKIPRECLTAMLAIVQCSIVSITSNSQVDAYVLSESSMFVSKRRFILKTCGTTTPLDCIKELTRLVHKFSGGYDTVEEIFYSRKNFQRPDLQKQPHRHFEQEVAILDRFFSDGAAYCMGSLNKDCWYIYTLNPLDRYVGEAVCSEADQTIEILMSDLDPAVMAIFHREHSRDGRDATKKSGIDRLLPDMKIDDYLFDPCGYSMNGVLQNEQEDCGLGEYMTIHITPEPQCSYVSFESNIPASSYLDIVQRVLNTFKPGKFILTIFATKTSKAAPSHNELKRCIRFGEWMRNDIQYCSFQDCDLTYAHFVRLLPT